MSDWSESLGDIKWRIEAAEKKRETERREREKAEKLRKEERRRLAIRIMNEPPRRQHATREPINRQAARLMRKAPVWAQPPVEPRFPRKADQKPRQKGKIKMANKQMGETTLTQQFDESAKPSGIHPSSLGGNSGIPKGSNPQEYFCINEVMTRVIEEINKSPQKLTALARAAIDARGVLDENMKALGGGSEMLCDRVKVALEDIRQARFAFVSEVAQMLNPLKELRAFLLDNQYETEIKRLREFCDLCERLQKLKDEGTLDAVADTMIKLAVA